jgi:glycosyltransferase involved in cell wall biosynthesis
MKTIFLAWSDYHRRNEVLAPLLGAEIVYIPNRFKGRWMRPLDYVVKFFKTCTLIMRERPRILFLQFPAIFIALPAWFLKVPYVVDAHNSTWQSFWHRVPMSRLLLRKAKMVIVHNDEILEIAREQDPNCNYIIVNDPISEIVHDVERTPNKFMLICSFAADEPIAEIMDVIRAMGGKYTFVIPGSLHRIPGHILDELRSLSHVFLTGFLSQEDYERQLCSCACAVVLTTREGCQPCGACEALASNTPLIVSKTNLIENLFGEWAILVDNSAESIILGIKSISEQEQRPLILSRSVWQQRVKEQINNLFLNLHGECNPSSLR